MVISLLWPGFNPWLGNRISQDTWRSPKEKKKKNLNTLLPRLNPCQGSPSTSCETTLLPLPCSSGHAGSHHAVLACVPQVSAHVPSSEVQLGPHHPAPWPLGVSARLSHPHRPETSHGSVFLSVKQGCCLGERQSMMNSHPGNTQGYAWCAVSTRRPRCAVAPTPTDHATARDLTCPLVDFL